MKFKKELFVFFIAALLLPALAAAYPALVPRTGQTVSIFERDDGDLQAGVAWPDPRFSDHGDTVTDNLTGLIWPKNANLLGTVDADNDTDGTGGDGLVTWQHALDYVAKLNRETYLGYSDWRLPNKKELRSLADYSRSPALPAGHPFTNVKSSSYWTSSFIVSDIWIVHFINGQATPASYSNLYHVWPVRAGHFDPITTTSTTSTSIPSTSSTTTTSIAPATTTTTSAAASTTTTSIEDKQCPIARTLGQDSPDLENLRAFRDGTLSRSAIGRKVIQLYYHSAASINAALEKSPQLRAFTRGMLHAIAPMLRKRY